MELKIKSIHFLIRNNVKDDAVDIYAAHPILSGTGVSTLQHAGWTPRSRGVFIIF
jgi:hypothetical protein